MREGFDARAGLMAFDHAHVWHPYAPAVNPQPVLEVESAHGARLRLADGRELIDGISSWWCMVHGYNHPVLNRALERQLGQMAHVMFAGLTHAPAVELTEALLRIVPQGLQHVFYADSGSVAVEVAIKMALQYWRGRGQPNKNRMLALKGGYHGDTAGAMAVCDPETGMHTLFSGYLPQQLFTERPSCAFHAPFDPRSCDDLERMLQTHRQEIAALILEPILQGAGGMWFYHPDYLRRARELCNEYEVLLIADEIATGFGRTGKLFACDWAGITPDILCLGKALTGGYLTMSAVLTTGKVAEGISAEGAPFLHGPTFMANPLACAVAKASVELLTGYDWQADVRRIEQKLQTGLAACAESPLVEAVRVLGAVGAVELRAPLEKELVQKTCLELGVWLRPFGKVLYLMPPFITSDTELDALTAAVRVLTAPTC